MMSVVEKWERLVSMDSICEIASLQDLFVCSLEQMNIAFSCCANERYHRTCSNSFVASTYSIAILFTDSFLGSLSREPS